MGERRGIAALQPYAAVRCVSAEPYGGEMAPG